MVTSKPPRAKGLSAAVESHPIAEDGHSIPGIDASQSAAWLHRGAFIAALNTDKNERSEKRSRRKGDGVMHMEVPPPAVAAVVVSLCIQDGKPIGEAARSKGSSLARRFPKIPKKLLHLWLEGESQCAAPAPSLQPSSPPERDLPPPHNPCQSNNPSNSP